MSAVYAALTSSRQRTMEELDVEGQQKLQQNLPHEAVQLLERAVDMKTAMFGEQSEHTASTLIHLAMAYDALFSSTLGDGDGSAFTQLGNIFDKAEQTLQRCEATHQVNELRASLYFHAGLFYERTHDISHAIQAFLKSIQYDSDKTKFAMLSHFHLAPLLSQQQSRAAAFEHAYLAAFLLEREAKSIAIASEHSDLSNEQIDLLRSFAIALRNLAVEQEFFKHHDVALQTYQRAVATAHKYLGRQHSVSIELVNDMVVAKERLQQMGINVQSPATTPIEALSLSAAAVGSARRTPARSDYASPIVASSSAASPMPLQRSSRNTPSAQAASPQQQLPSSQQRPTSERRARIAATPPQQLDYSAAAAAVAPLRGYQCNIADHQDLSVQVQDLRQRNWELDRAYVLLKKEFQEQMQSHQGIEQHLTVAAQQRQTSDAEIIQLQEEVSRLRLECADRLQLIEQINKQKVLIEELRGTADHAVRLDAELAGRDKQVELLQDEVSSAHRMLQIEGQRTNAGMLEARELQEAINRHLATITAQRDQLEKRRAENEIQAARMDELTLQLTTANNNVEQLRKDIARLQKLQVSSAAERNEMEAQYREKEQRLSRRLVRLEDEINSIGSGAKSLADGVDNMSIRDEQLPVIQARQSIVQLPSQKRVSVAQPPQQAPQSQTRQPQPQLAMDALNELDSDSDDDLGEEAFVQGMFQKR
eukprot:TRINITY_DN2287_c0_g4_i1.p1 TRINITY_DN2287_c0_g4~~TRINITY_DN2287_c0_g4_i1.p1  ORF type:complete len:707 (-),score=206.77 TRINITY_DN2287_c0_g4_i1:1170-3290(-)